MGRLRGIAILLTFSLGRAPALGAPPESPASPAEPATPQEQAPEKPSALEFVKAGAYLFNKGQLDKATSYFKAADRYRDQLTENEEIVLEVYLEKVETFYKNRKAEANATGVAEATAKAAAVAEATAKAAMAKATATDPTDASRGCRRRAREHNSSRTGPTRGFGGSPRPFGPVPQRHQPSPNLSD